MKNLFLKVVLFAICLPSGGILLLKVYGFAQMYTTAYTVFIPSLILLFALLWYCLKKHLQIFNLVLVGAVGGLIGTFGYDLIRVPFMLMGSRIFAPINMYGVWIADASYGSGFTDTIGWLYHFSNGITFGILYALFMKGKSIWWAIAYALLLETIFVVSPFGELFGLTTKPLSLVAAYVGHIAYGYPLGRLTRDFDTTVESLKFFKKGLVALSALVSLTVVALIFSLKGAGQGDAILTIKDDIIEPHLLRLTHGNSIRLKNNTDSQKILQILMDEQEIELGPSAEASVIIPHPGIFQVRAINVQGLKSVFILSEPVENFKP